MSTIIGRIALPLFASRAADPEALQRGLRLAIGLAMLLNLPMMAGLAILSPDVILVLFGEKWLPAAPILTILALAGMVQPVHAINLQMVLAQGQTRTFIRNEIAKKTIGVACVIAGSLFGIIGLAWSQVVYHVLGFLVNTQPARRSLGYGPLRQLADLWGQCAATLAMSIGVFVLRRALPLGPHLSLALLVPVGGAIYFATGWLVRGRIFHEAVQMIAESGPAQRLLRRAGRTA
jgi:O-antigen/teichoic acid export membrane protein